MWIFSSRLTAQQGGIMTYETFKEQLFLNLKEIFSDSTDISIRPFPHNNHMILDGLVILEPGCNVSPTIYLNHYYENYQKGASFSSIQEQILHYYYSHCRIRSIDTSFFTCFEQVRPHIVYKLIHYEKNKELLKEVPYFPYLDLAIVFYCLIQESPHKNASILIYNKHLAYWNISKSTLLHFAQKNTPLLLSFCCTSLADLIFSPSNVLPKEDYQGISEEAIPMYVLTNRQRLNGACCILYRNVLRQISERLNDSLYILPSSIHEVIVIPSAQAGEPLELSDIVKEINLTEVAPDEVLSDCVYYYDRLSGCISIC